MKNLQIIVALFFLHLVRTVVANWKPANILIVMADDMSATAMPPYVDSDHPMYQSSLNPRFQEFLQTATAFHGIAPMPVCGPSRASFLTGRYIDRLDIYNFERFIQQAAPNISTVFKYFKDKLNYEAFIAGKIFHTRGGDDNRDIEYLTGHLSRPRAATEAGNSECKGFMYCRKENKLADMAVVNRLAAFLAEMAKHPEKNFIAGAGFHRPHLTMAIPSRFLNGLTGDLPDYSQPIIPNVQNFFQSLAYKEDRDSGNYKIKFSDRNQQKIIYNQRKHTYDVFQPRFNYAVSEMRRYYYASIRYTLENFGKILDYLDLYGFTNNTHVVFLSDHGWQNGERRILGKNTLFPEATHVPLFIHYAGQKQSYFNKHPVSTRDIFPTLINLVQGPTAVTNFNDGSGMPLDGSSLVPGLTNPDFKHNRLVFSQYPRCQVIGQIQAEDCMTGPGLQCSVDSRRPPILNMGYTTYTDSYEYTEWREFNEIRIGVDRPKWTNMPTQCIGVGCMWQQIDPRLTGTNWNTAPFQQQLHQIINGKVQNENLAVNPTIENAAIMLAQSNKLKATLDIL